MRWLKSIYKVWMKLTIPLGWVMTRAILSILFFLVITPIGLVRRIFGKNPLDLKFNREDTNSYWIPKRKVDFEKKDYENQF